MSNIAWFFKKHLINKYLLVHIRNLIFITRCFVDRKFSIIATITISDDTMDGLLWLLLNHFWGNVYFLCIRLLTKWFTVDLTHFYFCLINNKQNKDKRWRAKRKWKSSTGNFLDMTEQSCQKYHRGDHKKVPSEEMLSLSSEVHWGRSEWAIPYLAFCELQIDYRRLSKKRTSTLLISKEVFFSIVTKGFKFLKVPKQKHGLSCSSKHSGSKKG